MWQHSLYQFPELIGICPSCLVVFPGRRCHPRTFCAASMVEVNNNPGVTSCHFAWCLQPLSCAASFERCVVGFRKERHWPGCLLDGETAGSAGQTRPPPVIEKLAWMMLWSRRALFRSFICSESVCLPSDICCLRLCGTLWCSLCRNHNGPIKQTVCSS